MRLSKQLTRNGSTVDQAESLLGSHHDLIDSVQLESLGSEHDLGLATNRGHHLDVGVTGDGAGDVGELWRERSKVSDGTGIERTRYAQETDHHWRRWSRAEGRGE